MSWVFCRCFKIYLFSVSFRNLAVNPPPHSLTELVSQIPYKIIGYLAIHSFGIRLMYPGTIGFLQLILGK